MRKQDLLLEKQQLLRRIRDLEARIDALQRENTCLSLMGYEAAVRGGERVVHQR